MSFFTDILKGGSKSKSTSVNQFTSPIDFRLSTGGGTVDAGITGATVDLFKPFSNLARDQSFNVLGNTRNDVVRDIQELRSLENPFIRARVRPTEEAFDRLRSDTSRDLGRRGLAGTLRTNELLKVEDQATRGIADQTALAQSQALEAIFGRERLLTQISSQFADLRQDELRQALAELGIGLEAVGLSERSRRTSSQQTKGEAQDSEKAVSNISKIGFSIAGLF